MARAHFHDTVLDDTGTPLDSAQVTVYDVDDVTGDREGAAVIYGSETGSTKANPMLTGNDGYWEFYVDYHHRYDIIIAHQNLSTRIIRIDAGWIAPRPQSVDFAQLALQVLPVGTVVDWWRPSTSVPLPTGWVIPVGQNLTASQHDFPGGGTIPLPDFRNKIPMGADGTKANANAGGATNATSDAPGINYIGGSHQVTIGTTNLPPHQHAGTTGIENSSLSHGHGTVSGTTTGESVSLSHRHDIPYLQYSVAAGTDHGIGGLSSTDTDAPKGPIDTNASGPPGHTHDWSGTVGSGGPSNHTHTFTTGDGPGSSTALDNRPRYIGLLKIMKVKNS